MLVSMWMKMTSFTLNLLMDIVIPEKIGGDKYPLSFMLFLPPRKNWW